MGPEAKIEKKLVERIKRLGGIAYKFTSPARRSVPDRLVLLPGGTVVFVEVKAPGERPTKLQAKEKDKIDGLGFRVVVVDSPESINFYFPDKG